MIARVNGEEVVIKSGISIAEYIKERMIDPKVAVVEHNGTIIACGSWPSVVLRENDVLEIVAFVGGG